MTQVSTCKSSIPRRMFLVCCNDHRRNRGRDSTPRGTPQPQKGGSGSEGGSPNENQNTPIGHRELYTEVLCELSLYSMQAICPPLDLQLCANWKGCSTGTGYLKHWAHMHSPAPLQWPILCSNRTAPTLNDGETGNAPTLICFISISGQSCVVCFVCTGTLHTLLPL